MTPFPTVFTLWYSRVHICTMNHGNEATNIKSPVDETLSFGSALSIPDIDPDDRYVQFEGYLDDSWFRGQDNVVENVVALQNFFYII